MRHDPIPCQKSETFDRGWDSDGTLTLDLAEARDDAESEMTSNFARLHVLRPAGGPPRETEVRLEVDASGMIHASAREVQTNRALEVRMSWKGEAEKDLRSGV